MSYYESRYDMPVCNHKDGLTIHNIGYSIGITDDGVPFEAEMQVLDDTLTMTVIMPSIFDSSPDESYKNGEENNISNVIGFRDSKEMTDYGILDNGMVDDGEEDDMDVTQRCVDYLLKKEIFSYTSNVQNGSVQYRVDVAGNYLIKIIITMMVGDEMWAYTDLEFRPFGDTLYDVNNRQSKIVDFSKFKNNYKHR